MPVDGATSLAGTLTGAGDLTASGTLTWSGGTMQGSGTTHVNGGLTLSGGGGMTLDARTLNNPATATWTVGLIYLHNGATIESGGTWDVQGDYSLDHDSGALSTFNNSGTFQKTGGSGTTYVEMNFQTLPRNHPHYILYLHYHLLHLDSEANGNTAPNVYHWNGSSWDQQTFDARDTSGDPNSVRASGITSYSPFALSDSSPTAVNLVSFTATSTGDAVLLTWETAMEINTVGFNVWRSETRDGGYVQVNDALIPAVSSGSVWGGSYAFTDVGVVPGVAYYYRLEELEVGGARKWYGPNSTEGDESDPTAVTLLKATAEKPGGCGTRLVAGGCGCGGRREASDAPSAEAGPVSAG